MEAKDARIALVTEVIKQAKRIKMAVWSTSFEQRIAETREKDLQQTQKVAVSNAAMVGLVYALPANMIFACFATYKFFDGRLTSDIVFPALAFFSNINRATALLPRLITNHQSAAISFNRLRQKISNSDLGIDPSDYVSEIERGPRVRLNRCTFRVPGSASTLKPILENCSMNPGPRSLAVIFGPVGSGKTTLLRSLLGHLRPVSGQVDVQGRVAYASPKPFLIQGSIRENILSGSPLDAPFYQEVLDAVALRQDMERLPAGDFTMLGGSAVALSGGQMSRVALARAIYARREVIVLDDPLASIDGQIRKHITDKVLGPNGILKGTTRVVTTSVNALIRIADVSLVVSEGTIAETQALSAETTNRF